MGFFEGGVDIDCEGLLKNLRREGTPDRVHHMELFLDAEIRSAVDARFNLEEGMDKTDPHHSLKLKIKRRRFLGYDYVEISIGDMEGAVRNIDFPSRGAVANDTAGLHKKQGRRWVDEHDGAIRNWEEFEAYPWPDPKNADAGVLEWFEKNLPDDMCVAANCHNIFENLNFLMGYETLCYAMFDQPDLIDAICERVGTIFYDLCGILLQFDKVKILFGGDDLGFKTGTLVSPEFLKEKILPWHKKMARLAHEHGRLYLLHSCGNIESVMDALIGDVRIDGKHSFEDTIEKVEDAKKKYGEHIALIGGIDVDFLCRADEAAIRKRVREVLDACMPGGGYCLGTGNTVANYIPLENYLVMLDEGRKYRL